MISFILINAFYLNLAKHFTSANDTADSYKIEMAGIIITLIIYAVILYNIVIFFYEPPIPKLN